MTRLVGVLAVVWVVVGRSGHARASEPPAKQQAAASETRSGDPRAGEPPAKQQAGASETRGAGATGHRLTSDLDGTYLSVGPVAGALFIQDNWNSSVGAELSLVHLREHCLPALLGISFGGVVFDDRKGMRTWAELEVAVDRLPVKFGISGGLAVELDRTLPPHFGAQATLWVFAGIVPYVRIGTLVESGSFFEAGVMIKVPVKIRY